MSRITIVVALALTAATAFAQPGPPPDRPGRGPGRGEPAPSVDSLIERLLTFDANSDGSLQKSELKDERLHALFGRADANNDGTATKDELSELLTKESAALATTPRRGGPMGGPPSPGGPPSEDIGRAPGGRGPMGEGPGGKARGPRPRPGQVLPAGLQDRLGLSEEQRRRVNALQEIVDTQLNSILTPEQRQMLNEPGPPQGPPEFNDGPPRGAGGPPRDRQRPNAGDRPASEPSSR